MSDERREWGKPRGPSDAEAEAWMAWLSGLVAGVISKDPRLKLVSAQVVPSYGPEFTIEDPLNGVRVTFHARKMQKRIELEPPGYGDGGVG